MRTGPALLQPIASRAGRTRQSCWHLIVSPPPPLLLLPPLPWPPLPLLQLLLLLLRP